MAHPQQVHPENQAWFEHGGNTALMFAARVGDIDSARHLVAAGANVNDRNAWGVSVLTMTAYSNFGPLVANPSFGGGGPFHLGGGEQFRPGAYVDLVEFLLKKGADPNLGAEKFTALHAAIMRRDERTVDLLLENGADPNIPLRTFSPVPRGSNTNFYFHRGWLGAKPIWLAANFGTPAMVRRLVQRGADPRFVHRAIHYGDGELSEVLAGGIFADRMEEVTTLLMAAIGMSRMGRPWVFRQVKSKEFEAEALEKVRVLVELGADVNAVNHEGRTALQHAESMKYASVVEFLRGAGRK
jgi:ankyrin repeat protein